MSAAIKHAARGPCPGFHYSQQKVRLMRSSSFCMAPVAKCWLLFHGCSIFSCLRSKSRRKQEKKKISTFATSTMAEVKGNKKERSFFIFITLRVTMSSICACAPPFFLPVLHFYRCNCIDNLPDTIKRDFLQFFSLLLSQLAHSDDDAAAAAAISNSPCLRKFNL